MQNALANHGYLPRDGRNVHYDQVMRGLDQYGLSSLLKWIFTYPVLLEYYPPGKEKHWNWWEMLTRPIDYAVRAFGMRPPQQKDSQGRGYLNLDQLGIHGVIEHDVSLTRLDFAQGDNMTAQPHLIADLLASSSNGKTINKDDFVQFRRRRYLKQKADNPDVKFEGELVNVACSEIGLLLKVLGNGEEVPVEYIRVFFEEGRLPREEGWKLTRSWSIGFVELHLWALKFKKLLGPPGEAAKPAVFVSR